MRKLLYSIIIFFLSCSSAYAYTETFYVCNGGDGSLPETDACATAWDETDFSNSANWAATDSNDGKIGPNDIVYFKDDGGNFNERCRVRGSGLSGSVVTLKKYTGGTPTFSTGSDYAVWIDGHAYIDIDGLTFSGGSKTQLRIDTNSSYIEIQNCTFGGLSDYGNVNINDSNYCYVHDNAFNAGVAGRTEATEANSIGINSDHNRIIANTFTDGNGHSQVDLFGTSATYNIIRGNTFIITDTFTNDKDANDASITNTRGPSYNLYEENTLYNTSPNTFINTTGLKTTGGNYNIWRKNVVYNFDDMGWNCYIAAGTNSINYNSIYNNTFYNLGQEAGSTIFKISVGTSYVADVTYNNFLNNILMTSGTDGIVFSTEGDETYITDNSLKNNFVYDITGDVVSWFGTAYTITQAEAHNDGQNNTFSGNLTTEPTFTDAANGDFTALNTNSNQIDAGAWLTTITSTTGSGTTFTVGDASFFYDGWSIPGETGDVIMTSAGQTATITSINYTTGEITVGSSISWTQNDGVSLTYKGTAPDIGAEESTPVGGSGTVYTGLGGGNISEAQVVAGGKTIIYTISGDTFVSTLGTDVPAMDDFIAGITCTSAVQTHGFAAEVAPTITYDDFSLNAAHTELTLTLDAVPNYNIDSNETWHTVVPATAVTSATQITASPDITISYTEPQPSGAGLSHNSAGRNYSHSSTGKTITVGQ